MSNVPPSSRRLSVAMIVRDEQEALPRALDSIRDIADEIVVVDTGSADGTVEIARRFGARVVEWTWDDDFSAARNHALQSVTGDWVLWLDAGEVVPRDVAGPLRRFVDDEADDANAYLILIVVPSKAGGASEQIGRVRLMPARKQLRFNGRIQESLIPALAAQNMSVVATPYRFERTAREHDDGRVRNKLDRDLKLLRMEIAENGQQPRLLNALGEVYSKSEQKAEAIKCFRQALATSQRGTTDMLDAYYGLLTSLEGSDQARDEQIAMAVEALETFPFDAQLLCAMGGYLQAMGRIELAARSYEVAHLHGQVDPETWHLRDVGDMAAACLNLALQIQGKDDRALEVLNGALVRNPSSVQLRRRLIELHVKHARLAEALEQIDQFAGDPRQREALRTTVRGACQAAQANWVPALSYLQQAYGAGCRDPLCLRWLCISLISTGSAQAAAPIVSEWLRIDPENAEARKYDETLRLGQRDAKPSHAPMPQQVPPIGASDVYARPPRQSHAAGNESWPSRQVTPTVGSNVAESPDSRRLRIDSGDDPSDANVHFRRGEAFHRSGDASQAEAIWREYLSRYPGSPEVVRALCELLLEQGRYQDAAEVAASLDPADPLRRPLTNLMAATKAMVTGDWSTAIARLEACRQSGYSSPFQMDQLAEALIELRQFSAAEQILQELIFREPMNPRGHRRVLRLYEETGRTAEAQTVRQRLGELARLSKSPVQQKLQGESIGN